MISLGFRVPTVDCGSPSVHTLVHHYSYFNKPGATYPQAGKLASCRSASLLRLAYEMDQNKVKRTSHTIR